MEALLEAAVLATIALGLVNYAIAVSNAIVDAFVLYSPLEEALAPVGFKKMHSSTVHRTKTYSMHRN